MWRDALLVGGKDLRVEIRSRVTTMQVAPYAVLVLLLFGFAFDQNHSLLTQAAPGLVLDGGAAVHAAGRAAQLRHRGRRTVPATGCAWRGSTRPGSFSARPRPSPSSWCCSRSCSGVGVVVLFGTDLHDPGLLVATAAAATARVGLRRAPCTA